MYNNAAYTNFDEKTQTNDRVLVLKPRPDQNTLDNKGLIDNRLFKGENNLHAIMDTQTLLWTMKYEKGGLPEPLKQSWTSFKRLFDYAEKYFNSRGVDISEVKQYAPSSDR
jgi:hypothetical protein